MPSLEGYRSHLDYSYAPGIFPAMECLLHRPEKVRRILVHSAAAGREGVGKLTAAAEERGIRVEEADRALARISGKDNCFAAAVFEKFSDSMADNRPHVDIQEARLSIFSKSGYSAMKNAVVRALLNADLTITARQYIGYETETGYHHYNVDVANYYETEEP